MKTRDRILETSLLLFNIEGEQNVTTVDIANEMDISPGNLYYHFRGKEVIIEELYSRFENQLVSLLNQSINDPLSIEDHWYFLYVIFEEIYAFRFFYLNTSDIIIRYPDIERRFRRLINTKINTIEQLCMNLVDTDDDSIDALDLKLLAEDIALCLLYWFPYQYMLNPNADDAAIMHKGVYHILNLVTPYSGEKQKEFISVIKELYKQHALNK